MKYFLGEHTPNWYKFAILVFLAIDTLLLWTIGPTATSWLIIIQFIFTLAMALKVYPLQSGGILAIFVVLTGLTTPKHAYHEIQSNLEVILLLVFMVAGIYFMKPLLMYIFSKIFSKFGKMKVTLSLLFVSMCAGLSAFLDALTVTAVLIAVSIGFYAVYKLVEFFAKKAADITIDLEEEKKFQKYATLDININDPDVDNDGVMDWKELEEDLEGFKSFLRSLVMHGVVGTALGGVMTIVGEPQNLLIGERMGWDFVEFFIKMLPVTGPVFICGLITTIILEKTGWFGYGGKCPENALQIISIYTKNQDENRTDKEKWGLMIQAISAVLLIIGLGLHLAPVGLIGLALIIIQTAFMGIVEEHDLGKAFEEALPFTALLVVFFVIVAMIHDQHLFSPIIDWALAHDPNHQTGIFYLANGVLSMISDNVFVATVYIGELINTFEGRIAIEKLTEVIESTTYLSQLESMKLVIENFKDIETIHEAKDALMPLEASLNSLQVNELHEVMQYLANERNQLEKLAVAVNTGTNLPSVATPNGQAAFLFLLTSALAPLLGLSYTKMLKMAFPYTIVLGGIGYIALQLFIA